MTDDERMIRELVQTWMTASREGDTKTVLGLMTEDAVFLTPGRPPMRKADFAAAAEGQKGMKIAGESEIQEIKVLGDWAFMWTRLKMTVQMGDAAPVVRAGHTLSVLQKENSRWRLSRDANLLAVVKE